VGAKRNISAKGDWTTQISLNSLGKLRFTLHRIPHLRAGREEQIQQMVRIICPTGKSAGVKINVLQTEATRTA
jgi:hypothetical protein